MKPEEIQKDIADYTSLEALKNSDAGRILTDTFAKDLMNTVRTLASGYKTMTRDDFVSHSAAMAERLGILTALTNAGSNKDNALDALRRELDLL